MRTGERYILAHDLGTSGNKATLYDEAGNLRCSAVCGYETRYPRDRFVEQDPEDWWRAVCKSTRDLMEKAGIGPEAVLGVSFSGMMMGCLPVDGAGKAPATAKQLQIIKTRCKGFDATGLSKGDANQILNRLFNDPRKRGRRL